MTTSLLLSASGLSAAEKPIESYYARISERDHFNSNGERLSNAAAIIRQDRANVHAYGKQDDDDDIDHFFDDKANRARLEKLLANGYASPGAEKAIINGTPLIYVEIYPDSVRVEVR